MSQANVEIVRRVYDAVARHDTATVLAAYDPEVEWDFSRSPFEGLLRQGVYRGHEGLRSFILERYEEAWGEAEDVCEELIDAGDEHVVSVVTSRGRGRASGAEVELTHAGLWAIREGKITRVVWFPTRAEALEAAGLQEQAMSQEKVEVIRTVMDLYSRGEWDEALRYLHPRIVWRSPEVGLVAGSYEGRDGVRQFWRDVDDAFDGFSATLEEVIARGDDRVVVGVRIAGRGRASGIDANMAIYQATTFQDGMAFRVGFFLSRADALEAAGLSE